MFIFGGEFMYNLNLAKHEAMELHEMLNMKTVNLLKSKLMQGVVFDQELKALLEKDVQLTITHINELKELYHNINSQNGGELH
ncbi:MAG: putative spore coat protein [Bacillales bacterium]|jgi:similar to spore coat protein|nr:putative spore coat protein [Bacillales bacterium]